MKNNKIIKSKITVGIIAVFAVVVIVSFTIVFSGVSKNKGNSTNLYGITEADMQAGEQGIITSATITNRKTGTAPFDLSDGAGNDISETDNVVRSFDEIRWTIETTMGLKDNSTVANVTGGYLNIEVTLPESCANVVKWDIDSMSWTEGTAVISEDGRTFSAKYHMSEDVATVPGKQNVELVLKVLGAVNNLEINPEFKLWIEGNSDNEKYVLSDTDSVKVSAVPNYNIELKRNSYTSTKATVNYDGEDKTGRIYGYSVVLQLYNENESKGVKGVEIPKGDINFDINLKLERTIEGTSTLEDITDVCTPILWNYKINELASMGNIPDRNMTFNTTSTRYARGIAPLGRATSNREESIYNSGNIQMTQNGSVINATINDYKFDGVFPKYYYDFSGYLHPNINYSANIGCFSAGYFQVFVPLNEETTNESKKCYLTVSDNNINVNSLSDKNVTTQMVNTDDSNKVEHVITKTGTYNRSIYLTNTSYSVLSTNTEKGDAFAYVGQNIFLNTKFVLGSSNEEDVYTANNLIKFDAEAVEPTLTSDGSKYRTRTFDGTMEFKVVYLCKKDGTNWLNQEEMNNATIEDLDMYENISDIPEGKLCVGAYFESISGNLAVSSGGNNIVVLPLKVKNTATIGNVYGFSQRTQMWTESLDRSIYTIDNIGNFTYPTPTYDSYNGNYIKAEYDEEGNYIDKGVNKAGTSLLVLGAKQNINIESLDNSDNLKENFDLGRNESEVTYKITPSLTSPYIADPKISGVTLKVTDTLPKGLSYIPGSSSSYGEPDITENEDGTTKLVWHIYDCGVGKDIEPIIFKAKIQEETTNSTNFTTTAVILADNEKVGNARTDVRTTTNTIKVTNLESHRLYKEVNTPVIEKNGDIKYTLTYLNKTDAGVPDFQLIDILPYNNDNRGTSYNGTYTLDHIDIIQTVDGTQTSNDNLTLYTTKSSDSRNLNAKDESIGVNDIWNSKNIGETINEEVASFALKGEVSPNSKVEIQVYIKTQGNEQGDSYINIASAQTNKNTDPIQTAAAGSNVVTRKISGMLWYDINENGIKDDSENYSKGIKVILKDTKGNEVTNTTTDENGYYEFNSLSKNDYVVEIETESKYKLTNANVGSNDSINSKFEEINGKKQSQVITRLNSLANSILSQEYENAGLIVKDAKVSVKYLDLNNKEITYTDIGEDGNDVQKSYSYEITGKIDETYTTDKKDIPDYIYRRNSGNTSGTFTETPINVVYYYEYNKQDITVTKVWNDNNNEANKRPSSIILELYENGSLKDSYKVVDTSKNTYTYTFKDLPKYDNEGKFIQYTVEEKEVNEGDLKFYNKIIDNDTNTITDTFKVPDEKVAVSLNLEWDDNNNEASKRPSSIRLELYENGKAISHYILGDTSSNTFKYTFEYLPKYDRLGNEISYTVDEKEVNENDLSFYTKNYDSKTNTITNKFTVPDEKTSVTVTVNWNDSSNINKARPQSMKVYLKNGDTSVQEYTLVDTTENTQSHEFTDLPKYDNLGNEITYIVDTDDVIGYDKKVSGTTIENTIKSYDITTRIEGNGGKISGQDETPYEVVTYYGTNKKDIKVTPDYGYKISSITINGDNIEFTPNQDGTYTLDRFANVTENKDIVVTFEKRDTRVVVRHVTDNGQDLIPQEVIKGKVGDNYSSSAKEFNDYDLKLIPDNANGTMTEEPIVVKYEYSLVKGSITIKLVDKDDETKVLSGAKFKIEKLNEDGSIDETFIVIEAITGEDGIVKFNDLSVGKYKVTQLEAVSDYKIDNAEFKIEISKDERSINITAQNKHISEVLQTVNTGDVLISIVAIIIICITTFVITSKKFKSKKD